MNDEEDISIGVPIDVTPMATIGLLIVIVFLCTAPTWMQPLMEMELPEAHTSESETKQNVTISIGANGELAIDDIDIKWGELKEGILVAMEGNEDKYVIIRAAKKVRYGKIIEAMNIAKQSGAKNLTIATKQIKDNGKAKVK